MLVHGYEQWGDGFVEKLNGMFAFAIWDKRKRRILIARDRTGIKPLYYTPQDGVLAWGPGTQSPHVAARSEARIDLVSLQQYLALEHIPPPQHPEGREQAARGLHALVR